MTSKIIKAFVKNESNFKNITRKCENLRTLQNQRENELKRVVNLYNIIFKNLSSRRKVIIKHDEGREYIATPTGISVKKVHSINAENISVERPIDMIKEFEYLAKHGKEVKQVLSKDKAKIYFGFIKKIHLLKIGERNYVDVRKKFYELDVRGFFERKLEKEFVLTRITFDGDTYNAILNLEGMNQRHIPMAYFSLEYGSVIEQILPEINKLIDKTIKQRQKELINIRKFIDYCKVKFENQLVLEELSI